MKKQAVLVALIVVLTFASCSTLSVVNKSDINNFEQESVDIKFDKKSLETSEDKDKEENKHEPLEEFKKGGSYRPRPRPPVIISRPGRGTGSSIKSFPFFTFILVLIVTFGGNCGN
jgi:hypothetical protein